MPNDQSAATVAVTGATGFVGRHAVAALLDAGHSVRALVRSSDKAARVLPASPNLSLVRGDALDPEALADLLAPADAVVHTIGIRREHPPAVTFKRLHHGATAALVAAAQHAGARRFIHISALGTRNDAPTEYWRSKLESETTVRRSGLDWTILRPALIHGHDGEFVQLVKGWVLGRTQPHFFLPWFARVEIEKSFPPKPPRLTSAILQPVLIDDVAGAIVAALQRDESIGEVYPLAGPDSLDWPSVLTTIRDAMPVGDKDKKPRPIPADLGVALATTARVLGLADLLPFGPGEPAMAREDATASTAKAAAHLGFSPSPFFESVEAYATRI